MLQLLVPGDIIREKIKPFQKRGKPTLRADRAYISIEGLIALFNSEIPGLVNYYCMAANVARQLYKFYYYHYYSLVKTVCFKYKLSMIVYETTNGPKQLAYFHAPIKRVKSMIKMHRKTLVLCGDCHKSIHRRRFSA